MQQQNTKPIVSSNSGDYATEHLQTDYTCPVDVSIPPPSFTTSSTSYFVQHPPPATYLIAPPPIKIKEEIKEEIRRSRSPSPYSPSRPTDEDEDDLAYFNKGEFSTCIGQGSKSAGLGSFYQSQYSWVS